MNAIPIPQEYRSPTPRLGRNRFFVRILIVSLVVLFLGGYFFYQAKGFIMGPRLEVVSPHDGQTLVGASVRVEGNTTPGSAVTINGARIDSDGAGHFSDDLLLAPGIHVLQITAKDRFGKVREVIRQISVQ